MEGNAVSGKNSRARRVLAVGAARLAAYGSDVSGIVANFDERQMRIYQKYLKIHGDKKAWWDALEL